MLGQGVKRWHFADPLVPCRQPPHRPDADSTAHSASAHPQVPPAPPPAPLPTTAAVPPPPSTKKSMTRPHEPECKCMTGSRPAGQGLETNRHCGWVVGAS